MDMRVVGLDASLLQTGICGPELQTGVMCPPPKLQGPGRLAYLRDNMERVLSAMLPDVILLEEYAFGAVSSSKAQIAEWGGVLRLLLYEHGWKTILINPSLLKIYVTGNGNAKKEDLVSVISAQTGRIFPCSDEADAWALAAMAWDYLGEPILKVPARQRLALDKVDWSAIGGSRPPAKPKKKKRKC